MRSVEKFDTRSTISCHMVESFVSCFKFLTRSAENFVGRITSLSLTFEVFVSWIQVLFHSTVFSRRESLLCLTVSKKLLGAPQFCPSYEKNDSRVTFLSEKDKIFEIFFKKKSHNVKFFEEWIINLYHGVEKFVRWITILSHISESLWQESKVCLTKSKNSRSEVQFCHTLLEKIVAVITILSHYVNNFVSCIEVLFRSVRSSEREKNIVLHCRKFCQ